MVIYDFGVQALKVVSLEEVNEWLREGQLIFQVSDTTLNCQGISIVDFPDSYSFNLPKSLVLKTECKVIQCQGDVLFFNDNQEFDSCKIVFDESNQLSEAQIELIKSRFNLVVMPEEEEEEIIYSPLSSGCEGSYLMVN